MAALVMTAFGLLLKELTETKMAGGTPEKENKLQSTKVKVDHSL